MSSDDDSEYDEIDLSTDEQIEVIEWAASSAAMIALMWTAPEPANQEEALEKLEGFLEAINIMIDEMPMKLAIIGGARADEVIDNAIQEEQIVEEFTREVEEWDGTIPDD